MLTTTKAWRALWVLAVVTLIGGNSISAAEPLIRPGDRVALIGGTLIETLQFQGDCEAAIVLARPDLRVPVRNLGWSGDDASGSARRVFGSNEDGYTRLMSDLGKAAPTVAVIGYGWAEASNGKAGVAAFRPALERLSRDLQERSIRLIYVQPFALPGVQTDGYEEHISACRRIIAEVATAMDGSVIDPGVNLVRADFDEAGLRLSERGGKSFGHALAADLTGVTPARISSLTSVPVYGEMTARAVTKDSWFFHRHRPMNETYLFLFRKHEQGNNAPEVEEFEPLTQQAEREMWELSAKAKN